MKNIVNQTSGIDWKCKGLNMQIESLYEELRISKKQARKSGATPDKLFRELVNKYHPDRHRGTTFTAEDVMKDINRLWQKMR